MTFSAHLNHPSLVAQEVRFKVLPQVELTHVLQRVPHGHVLAVDQPEGSHVDKVVLKVLQIERLQVEGGEEVMVLVLDHLDLKDPTQKLLQVPYISVHD